MFRKKILEYSFNIQIRISCLDGTQMFDPKHDNCATLFSWLTIKPYFSFYQTKNYCIIWPNWIRRFTAHYPIDKRPERSVDRPLLCLIFPNISFFLKQNIQTNRKWLIKCGVVASLVTCRTVSLSSPQYYWSIMQQKYQENKVNIEPGKQNFSKWQRWKVGN